MYGNSPCYVLCWTVRHSAEVLCPIHIIFLDRLSIPLSPSFTPNSSLDLTLEDACTHKHNFIEGCTFYEINSGDIGKYLVMFHSEYFLMYNQYCYGILRCLLLFFPSTLYGSACVDVFLFLFFFNFVSLFFYFTCFSFVCIYFYIMYWSSYQFFLFGIGILAELL